MKKLSCERGQNNMKYPQFTQKGGTCYVKNTVSRYKVYNTNLLHAYHREDFLRGLCVMLGVTLFYISQNVIPIMNKYIVILIINSCDACI